MTRRLLPVLLLLTACTADTAAPSFFQLRMTNISPAEGVMGDMGMYAPRFSPGWVRVGGDALYAEGEAASGALTLLAEAGDPIRYAETEGFSIPEGFEDTYMGSPLASGESFAVRFEAVPGQRLHFASMFIESNDTVVGFDMPLFDGDTPRSGDITADTSYYDVGSEVNEPPGFGPGQPGGEADGEDELSLIHI